MRIAGATHASYSIGRHVYGRLSVRVRASAPGHLDGVAQSDVTPSVGKGDLRVSRPAELDGRLSVGSTLHVRAHAGSVSPRPRDVGFRWLLDGHRPRSAQTSRLELKPWMRGKHVRVQVIYWPPTDSRYRRLVQEVRGQHPVR